MATLTIRKLDDEVYENLRRHAKARGRSIESEVRALVEERYRSKAVADYIQGMRDRHAAFVAKHGYLPDSTPLIREMRDEE